MSRNDWHEAKMGTCGCGRWAKVLDDMCAECHDAERQEQREAAYLKRISELRTALSELACWAKDIAGDCDDPIQRQQEDEMMERINKILEKDNE